MTESEKQTESHWMRTVGGPRPGDPRDGELHQVFGPLRHVFDLEPWDDADHDARYVRDPAQPPALEDGRLVWIFEYRSSDEAKAGPPVRDLTMIGFWRNSEHPELPDPASLVDPTWDQWERHVTVQYLANGALAVQWRGYSWCRLCDLETNGSSDLTDGVYVWPSGLAHYVKEHAVRLPRPLIEHFRAQTSARETAAKAAYDRGPREWVAMTEPRP